MDRWMSLEDKWELAHTWIERMSDGEGTESWGGVVDRFVEKMVVTESFVEAGGLNKRVEKSF